MKYFRKLIATQTSERLDADQVYASASKIADLRYKLYGPKLNICSEENLILTSVESIRLSSGFRIWPCAFTMGLQLVLEQQTKFKEPLQHINIYRVILTLVMLRDLLVHQSEHNALNIVPRN